MEARGNNFTGKPRPMESENHREPPVRTQLGNPIWIIENSWGCSEYACVYVRTCVRIRAVLSGERQAVNARVNSVVFVTGSTEIIQRACFAKRRLNFAYFLFL